MCDPDQPVFSDGHAVHTPHEEAVLPEVAHVHGCTGCGNTHREQSPLPYPRGKFLSLYSFSCPLDTVVSNQLEGVGWDQIPDIRSVTILVVYLPYLISNCFAGCVNDHLLAKHAAQMFGGWDSACIKGDSDIIG